MTLLVLLSFVFGSLGFLDFVGELCVEVIEMNLCFFFFLIFVEVS
jgi:hypothetical protein